LHCKNPINNPRLELFVVLFLLFPVYPLLYIKCGLHTSDLVLELLKKFNTISEKTTIVWNFSIALVGVLREAPLPKCLYYLLHIIKGMI
jgi:hypothetical protein